MGTKILYLISSVTWSPITVSWPFRFPAAAWKLKTLVSLNSTHCWPHKLLPSAYIFTLLMSLLFLELHPAFLSCSPIISKGFHIILECEHFHFSHWLLDHILRFGSTCKLELTGQAFESIRRPKMSGLCFISMSEVQLTWLETLEW